MEHVNRGNMFDYLPDRGRVTESVAQGISQQLVSAVQYCHQRGIGHRDLKTEN